jgi:hypothetical protein
VGDPAVIWTPQPGPQTALIECPVFEIFYGGARGGGKTEGSLGDWLEHSGTYGEGAIGVFFRKELRQLDEVIARTHVLFPKIKATWNGEKKQWTMPNRARLKFAYIETDAEAEKYQGHSYTRVYIEEATNFATEAPIAKLRATLRSGAGVPTGMRLTGNPGGPGHRWVKERYIAPCPTGFKIITDEVEYAGQIFKLERVFIPSKLSDNILLMQNDPTYVVKLMQSGSKELVRAWLEGDWDAIEGVFFSQFKESEHVLSEQEWRDAIPRDAVRFRSFDWGSSAPFSVGWYAISDGTWGLPRGAIVKYREWYGASGPNKGLRMDAEQVARGILEREREAHETIRYGVADPAIFARDGGPSIAERMAVTGCQFRRGDNKRNNGWDQVRARLTGEFQRPMFYLFDSCPATIEQLQTMQADPKDSEDIDTHAEDHALDETRYALMSRPYVPRAQPPPDIARMRDIRTAPINEIVRQRTAARLRAANA